MAEQDLETHFCSQAEGIGQYHLGKLLISLVCVLPAVGDLSLCRSGFPQWLGLPFSTSGSCQENPLAPFLDVSGPGAKFKVTVSLPLKQLTSIRIPLAWDSGES